MSELPIVSLAGMRSADVAAKAAVGDAVREACLDKGFLYVVDHGVPEALTAGMLSAARAFFALPLAEKLALEMSRSSCNRGYEPLRGQTLESGAPPDLKEGFYLGADLAADDSRVVAGWFNHGPNQWPLGLVGWRETMESYFTAMTSLCRTTMEALALSLDLGPDYFESFCEEPMATLRLLHYPPQPANPSPGEKGCGAHTDFGAITYLLQDSVGGLQVWDETLGWCDAPPVAGAFVLNLGDLIARWTNERYRSTLHRVINATGCERYSVPFFFTGRADHEVSCLPSCLVDGETALYPPTTTLGHLRACYDRTYARI